MIKAFGLHLIEIRIMRRGPYQCRCRGSTWRVRRFSVGIKIKTNRLVGSPRDPTSEDLPYRVLRATTAKAEISKHGGINIHSPILKYSSETTAHDNRHNHGQSQQQSPVCKATISSKNRISCRPRNTLKLPETTILSNVKRTPLQTATARRL